MRHVYTVFALGLFAVGASAQPTITNTSNPAIGESMPVYVVDEGAVIPSSGTNVTWNYSALGSGTLMGGYDFVAPDAAAPAGSNLMDVGATSMGVTAYYKASNDAFSMMGVLSPSLNLSCAGEGMIVYAYPFTMGSTRNNTIACSGQVGEYDLTRAGSAQLTALGYGTLIMPYGTLDNVLLIKLVQTYSDNFSNPLIPIVNYTIVQYMFMKPGVKTAILSLGSTTSNMDPGNEAISNRMLGLESVGIKEAMANAIGMELAPNPATATVELLCGALAAGEATVEVVDLQGRTVLHKTIQSNAAGIQREMLEVGQLMSGLYTVRVTDAQGATGTKRLVVQ